MPARSPSRNLSKLFGTRATAPIQSKENTPNEITCYVVCFVSFCRLCLRQRCEDRDQGQRYDLRRVCRQCQERINQGQRREECRRQSREGTRDCCVRRRS